MLYAIIHLKINNFIDIDISEVHNGYRKHLINSMYNDYDQGNNDFLHGATGVALYLLKNNSPNDMSSIIKYIEHIELTAIEDKNGIKWESEVSAEIGKAYSIALAHGMSAIAIFLAKSLKLGIETDKIRTLLNKLINYIMNQEIDHNIYGCYFPSTSIESEENHISKSRLGWCYGDLGVASALWQVGKTMNNEAWKEKAIEVYRYAATRRELESNSIKDACLCHGTAGVAQMFKRMYIETQDEIFLDASNFWIEETLKIANWEDGLAGYKMYTGLESEWENKYYFLEGITGVGLALLASIGDDSYSNWDEILLLS